MMPSTIESPRIRDVVSFPPHAVGMILFALLLLPTSYSALNGQERTPAAKPGASFDGDRAMAHVIRLCDPALEGRQSGLPGADLAERYGADAFRAFGLEPAGDGDTYLQTFPMLVTRLDGASMAIEGSPFGRHEPAPYSDFYPLTHSGSGEVRAEAIFVGHGISRPEKDWDDYLGCDLEGAVAVIHRGAPSVPGVSFGEEQSRNYLLNEAFRRGASAVLFLQGGRIIHGAALQEEAYHEHLLSAYIADHVAEKLLAGTDETLDTYREKLKSGPCLLRTGRRVSLRFSVTRIRPGRAANVVGLLPGADPELADEVLIVGGHLDHLGVCPDGGVFAGAMTMLREARWSSSWPGPSPRAPGRRGAWSSLSSPRKSRACSALSTWPSTCPWRRTGWPS